MNQPLPYALYTTNLSKSYGQFHALRDISFHVHPNELFGIIGPDGAGKTTLFRLLTSLLLPTSGKAITNGFNIKKEYKEVRKIIGYMPGRFSLYQDLTVEENLHFFAKLFGANVDKNYHLVADIYDHIKPFKNRKAGDLSGGMKQKLALSCALIHHPKILFLDEPTTGIDAVSRKELWDMLKLLKDKDVTIVVSTPYMDEAILCDRILLLQEGQVLDINTPEGIIAGYKKHLVGVQTNDNKTLIHRLRQLDYLDSVHTFGYSIHAAAHQSIDISRLRDDIQHEFGQVEIQRIRPTIEDCFIELMSQPANA